MTPSRNTDGPAGSMQAIQTRMRELRLWHYEQAVQKRSLSLRAACSSQMHAYDVSATQHERFVLWLNEFFAVGDTAELDHDRQHSAPGARLVEGRFV